MTARRHIPPSRLRYEAAHPTVAVQCDLETKARLVALRETTGHSLGELVKQTLGLLERDVETARRAAFVQGHVKGRREGVEEGRITGVEEGRKAGFAEAVRRYRITYPCKRCGKLMVVTVGAEDAEEARQALIDAGWGHTDCLQAGAQ